MEEDNLLKTSKKSVDKCSEKTVGRASEVVPLVLHLFIRPNHPTEEPIKRTNILAEDKIGSPSQVMQVLGWELDTRRLLIILSQEKFLNIILMFFLLSNVTSRLDGNLLCWVTTLLKRIVDPTDRSIGGH